MELFDLDPDQQGADPAADASLIAHTWVTHTATQVEALDQVIYGSAATSQASCGLKDTSGASLNRRL